jgi:hypothetical protein
LQNENAKLRTQVKLHSYNLYKDEGTHTPKTGKTVFEDKIKPIVDSAKFISRFDNNKNSQMTQNQITQQDNEEWLDILRHSGLTPEELDRLSKNKAYTKLIEAIEMLSRLLVDKSSQIRLLEQENENLNYKNINLNKENINIFQQNIDLKKKLEKMMKRTSTFDCDTEDNNGVIIFNK